MIRRGTTLLEIVVALSLAAMLMVALSGVLAGLVRQRRHAEIVDSREWIHALDNVFWNDLAQARSVALDEGVLWMVVPSSNSSHGDTNELIAYRLNSTGKEQFALVRAVYSYRPQLASVGFSKSNSITAVQPLEQKTLVWNVSQASFERIDDSGQDQPFPRVLGPAPRGFRYRIWLRNVSEPINRQITVR